jgi:hypothetical protein
VAAFINGLGKLEDFAGPEVGNLLDTLFKSINFLPKNIWNNPRLYDRYELLRYQKSLNHNTSSGRACDKGGPFDLFAFCWGRGCGWAPGWAILFLKENSLFGNFFLHVKIDILYCLFSVIICQVW